MLADPRAVLLEERGEDRLELVVIEGDEFVDVRAACGLGCARLEQTEQRLGSADVSAQEHGLIVWRDQCLTFTTGASIFAGNDLVSVSGAADPTRLGTFEASTRRSPDTHLRYLEKWGLVRADSPRGERLFSFTDLLTVKQVAAELESGIALRVILRTLLADRQGQLALDFQPGHGAATRRAPRWSRCSARKDRNGATRCRGGRSISPGASAVLRRVPRGLRRHRDPQRALAAKYFAEGSRLDDGDGRKMEEAASAYRKALVVDPDLVPAIVNLVEHPLRARPGGRSPGPLRTRDLVSIPNASRRTSTSATFTTISAATGAR